MSSLKKPGAILITGGAGYIGSHALLALGEAGFRTVAVDDLSSGDRALVPGDTPFYQSDAGDKAMMQEIMKKHECIGVMHFAGSIIVPESVRDPLKYYRNNAETSRQLIEAAVNENIKAFIFSSTASVYGAPDALPVGEDARTEPKNPYGSSKLVTEWILRDAAAAHGLPYAALRYFNVAGADPLGRAGQMGRKSSHLIKIAAETLAGRCDRMDVFGGDYDTPDGTCIRDFIHVSDLVSAHVAALTHLLNGGANLVLNCGYGKGASVLEVLKTAEKVSGQVLAFRFAPRRPGDVPVLVADARKIRETLKWTPRFDDLGVIIRSALEWERKLANKNPGKAQ